MCICPTIGLKIGLLICMFLAAIFNVVQLTADIPILKFLSSYHEAMVYVGLVMCLVVVIFMIIGFYGAIRNKFIILAVTLAVLMLHCVIKLIVVIVVIFGPRSPEKRITHVRFFACFVFSMVCMIANILFCFRLKEITQEEYI